MAIDYAPRLRCVDCGCPHGDHVPARYWLKCQLLHLLPDPIARIFRPLRAHHQHR